MEILIVTAKLAIVATYVQILWMLKKFKDQDPRARMEFDLLSKLSLCVGIGISLVSVAAVITEETYLFTLALCLISLAVVQLERRQIIVAGDRYVLISARVLPIRDIERLETGLYTLRVVTEERVFRVHVPLTSRETLQERIYQKIKK